MRASKAAAKKRIEIEFLYLDLDTCTRCKGTDANLETALRAVHEILRTSGAEVSTRKILVDSDEIARKLKFESSPTIRINGRDIALEFRESPCDCSAELCACGGGVDCRVWLYEDKEYTEAPVPMIVNALLRDIYGTRDASDRASAASFKLPENLRDFFATKAARESTKSCCSTDEKTTCCEPDVKLTCCGSGSNSGKQRATATCECQ